MFLLLREAIIQSIKISLHHTKKLISYPANQFFKDKS